MHAFAEETTEGRSLGLDFFLTSSENTAVVHKVSAAIVFVPTAYAPQGFDLSTAVGFQPTWDSDTDGWFFGWQHYSTKLFIFSWRTRYKDVVTNFQGQEPDVRIEIEAAQRRITTRGLYLKEGGGVRPLSPADLDKYDVILGIVSGVNTSKDRS